MSDLAAQTQLTTSGITRVVDRLERDGLVERRACPTDRRGSFAAITEAGLAPTRRGAARAISSWSTSGSPSQLTPGATWTHLLAEACGSIRDAVRPEATAGALDRP